MKQRFKLFGIYTIYWLVFFVLARFLFLVYQNTLSFDLPLKDWFLSFLHGFRMDLSATGYILTLVGLLLTFTTFASGKWINRILKPITIIILTMCSSIVIADLELYNNWGYRMDSTPLLYITKPQEAMASTELWLTIVLLFATAGLVVLGIYMYNKKLKPVILKIERTKFYAPLIFLVLTASMILPVRGGIGIAPMNTGMVYFGENKFGNHVAVNVVWNVMHSLTKSSEGTADFMAVEEANTIVNSIKKSESVSSNILTASKPNVVIILLESFTSKVIGALNGEWDATPNFNKLAKQGILFTNFYANGNRSDKGIVSVLSAYPAQPTTSIIKTPKKTENLPSLFESFNLKGYKTAFYYGGDVDFANMRSYFLNIKTNEIISDEKFDSKLINSKWGVHDEHLFNKLFDDIESETEPFFKLAFTLSSHEPFEVPMKDVFEGSDKDTKFRNSVYYTDSCLGDFFDKIKQTEIWNNTLFILVADHGSTKPGKTQNHQIESFKIPMLWLGGVLSDSIMVNESYGSQIDIAASLLNQLSFNSEDFIYSKDLFNENDEKFAYYVYNNGFGFLTDSTKLVFDNTGNRLLFNEGVIDKDLLKAKAITQFISHDYKSR